MQLKRTQRNIVLAAATAASLAFGGHVSAQVIRITNAGNHEIPLKAGSSVQIDSSGNLLAECALTNNTCTALSTGGSQNPNSPTVSLSRTDNDNDVKTNEAISLSWTSTNAEACKATASPAHSSFAGVQATSGSATFVPGTVATHVYSVVCYNAAGASTTASVQVPVTAGAGNPGPTEGCNITAGTQGHAPPGWASTITTWSALFTPRDGSPIPAYPASNGFPVPIGASRGAYTAASFKAQAGQTVNMFWEGAQANQFEGYSTARPAIGMFISISPCPGDLRPADTSQGGFLATGCRRFANTGTIIYTTSPAVSASNDGVCKLEVGKDYYINVLPANPNDGLTLGEHSCSETPSSAQGCDVQAKSTFTTFAF